jgi:hypothetical protein
MNLIPFALSLDKNTLVDVSDVQSGKKCGCICPSCNIPLVAKKGNINEWHFAHDSQYIDKDQELTCDFSWSVAVKMMIKQLLLEGSVLYLPEYYIDFQSIGYQKHKRKIKVTDPSTVPYNAPELKSYDCDIAVEVKGKKLGIILLDKYSPPTSEDIFDAALFGVIAISINQVDFDDNGKVVNHFRNHLRALIESEARAKHWLYHKREKSAYLHAMEQDKLLHAGISCEPIQEPHLFQKRTQGLEAIQWYCVSCQLEYLGTSVGINPCPKCKSHFYRKTI